jgi:hypothetical protein
MKLPTALITLSTAIHLLAYLLPQAMPEHLADMSWPAHARFHMWQATFWLVALDVVILLVALIPFRMKQTWALWVLMVGLLGAQVGYFLASMVVPEGRPDTQGADIGLLVVMLIYVAGLALGWRDMRRS